MIDEGVRSVDPDTEKNVVTVKGTMDPQKLVEFINKRGGRHVEIVKQSSINQRETTTTVDECHDHHDYPQQLLHAPQLFSDENPNSCALL